MAAVVATASLIIGTGGGAGFALAGGGIFAQSAAAAAAFEVAKELAIAGSSMFLASIAGKEYENNRQKKGTPRNNQAQNRQFDEAVRTLRKKYGINMTKDRIRQLHDAISHMNYSLQDIINEGISLFGGR